jgi:hypothetical protein
MDAILQKITAVLAAIIGLMAVFAGGRVLLGNLPDYYVINWLPVYNFILGIISVSITAILIWKNHRFAIPATVVTFSLHTVVMLILQTAYRPVVAIDSVVAMSVRLIVWTLILALLGIQQRKNKFKKDGDES